MIKVKNHERNEFLFMVFSEGYKYCYEGVPLVEAFSKFINAIDSIDLEEDKNENKKI